MARRKAKGLAGASSGLRDITTLRDLIILRILEDGGSTASEVESEYEMWTQEIVGNDSIRQRLDALMKTRKVRYGSEQVAHESLLRQKHYALTPAGLELLNKYRDMLAPAD